MKSVHAIVAVATDWAIGRQGDLLCHLPADMKHFKEVTMGHSIIMGRKTFESFPRRPLPGRQNIVITRNANWQYPGVTVVHSLDEAIASAETDIVFIIGGAQVYEQALPRVDVLHLTLIHARWASADAFFPALNMDQWQEVSREHHESDHRNAYEFDFITLKRREP
jgi:dihydrofolate reductase